MRSHPHGRVRLRVQPQRHGRRVAALADRHGVRREVHGCEAREEQAVLGQPRGALSVTQQQALPGELLACHPASS
jgi:hypothetical protein